MKSLKKLGTILIAALMTLGVGLTISQMAKTEGTNAAGAYSVGVYRILASGGTVSDSSFAPFTKSGTGWAAYGSGATAAEATTYSVSLGTKTIRTGTQGDYLEYLNITDLVNAESVTSVTVSIKTKSNTTTAESASEFTIQGYNGSNTISDASATIVSDYASLPSGFAGYYNATTTKTAVLTTTLGSKITGLRITHSKKTVNTLFTNIDLSWDGTPGVNVPVEDVEISPTEISLPLGEQTVLTENVLPENASNKSVTWESSNVAIATVNNGVVTATGMGSANITVTTVDQSKSAISVVNVTAGPSYQYTALDADLPAGTVNGSYLPLNSMDWSVSWTNGLAATTVGVSTFDAVRGFHFGTGSAPVGSVSFRSRLFVSPSNSNNQISSVIVEASSAAGNKANTTIALYIGGVLINSYNPTDASANTPYSFVPATNVHGHIEVVLTNNGATVDLQAAIYKKNIKVWADNSDVDLGSALVFASQLETFDSCGTGDGFASLLTGYNALNVTAKNHLANIMLDDKNNYGQAPSTTLQKDVVSAASKWAYVSAKFGGGSGASSVDVFGQKSIYIIVIIGIVGITSIGAIYFLKKKKEQNID